jgi:hypothetical protein
MIGYSPSLRFLATLGMTYLPEAAGIDTLQKKKCPENMDIFAETYYQEAGSLRSILSVFSLMTI